MLEPREADIPVLFLVLVVLPLVAYILLGKWSESAKKRERISLLAQLAAEESFRAEVMATAWIIPPVSTSKNGVHVCARCFSPATTRCSRCKSVRYCSGKCQINHWRQVHKEECQQMETTSSCSSPMATSCDESILEKLSIDNGLDLFSLGYNSKQLTMDNGLSDNNVHPLTSTGAWAAGNCPATVTTQEVMLHRSSQDKQVSCKSNKEMSRRQDVAVFNSSHETSGSRPANLTSSSSISNVFVNGQDAVSTLDETRKYSKQHQDLSESRSNCGPSSSLSTGQYGINAHEIGIINVVDFSNAEASVDGEMAGPKCSYETQVTNGNAKVNTALHPMGNKSLKPSKSKMKFSGDQSYFKIDGKGQLAEVARMHIANPAAGTNGVTSIGIMSQSSKLATQDNAIHKKLGMLFPYEEFVKIFNCEVIDLTPRGLVNCGNSCYANAVLQCLTCTKPLMIFLLRRSHSRACCGIDWCLMCELEQHVMMLRGCGGPLSPSRILKHMRKTNSQIGNGSQEDAHEFLRLLIASMQSICLEKLGGEDKVDPRLQETTFIHLTFGGRLRSKVHPVSMSQVMLEGAYILFYMRSCPRPQKAICEKTSRQQAPLSFRHCMSRTHKPSRQGQSNCSSHFVVPEASLDVKPENGCSPGSYANGIPRRSASKNITQEMDFSDATSSDWSLFTSSDEASFTTESTSDSFSTIDYADACNADAFSSIFNDLYAPESSYQKTTCRRTFSNQRPQTRFILEERGYVLDLYSSTQPPESGKEKITNRSVIHQPNSLRTVPAPCL
ncbi:hypothetical protein DKX38_017570 [Salix brachista]|uniref:MYND-type domain-containing protein n=1 Tax=Salix brachista TaxID=2182728 RepID=A0A5N5KVM3_9ROSI|nr:hypothetical protein DKX38_017570 [Salix brachista]